jgi:O-antigen/teichoic acid export membrane protein
MTAPGRPSRLFRSERIGQGLSVYLPASALSRMVGLTRALVLARVMATEQWGLLQIALLVVNLLNPLCSLGLNDSLQRYVPMHETRGTLRRFLGLALPSILAIGAVLCGVVLLFARPRGVLLFTALNTGIAPAEAGANAALTRMAAIAAFGLIAFFFIFATLKGLRMYRAAGLIELVHNLIFTTLAIVLCLRGPGLAAPVVGCYAVALFGMSLLVAWPLRRAVRRIEPAMPVDSDPAGFSPRAVVLQMLHFSLWSALAAVTWQVLLGYPMWYLNKAAGSKVEAVFAGVQTIAQGVVLVASSIVVVVETAVTKTWESQGPAQADRNLLLAYKATTLLLLAGGVTATALAPQILRLFPGQYAAGAPIFRLLILFFLLAGHLLFMGVHFHLIERTRHVFVPWLLGVLGHVVFSAALLRPGMPPAEAQSAAAWAGIAGMSLALAAALILVVVERRPMDRGLWVLIAAGFALAVPVPWAAPVMLGAVLLLTFTTHLILSREQKGRLREQVHAAWRKLGSLTGTA